MTESGNSSARKNKLKTFFRGFVLFAFLGGIISAFVSLDRQGFFNISKIEIKVEDASRNFNFVQFKLVKLEKKMEIYQELSLWKIDLDEVSKNIQGSDWIDVYRVSKSWPSTLTIYVKPHRIEGLLINNAGKLNPVTKEGALLESIDATRAPDVVLMHGENFKRDFELRKKAIDMIRALPDEGRFSKKNISQVSYSPKDGFWASLAKENLKVKLGEDQILLKAQRVGQVLEYLDGKQMIATEVDANLSKKVLVKTKK